MTPGKVFAMISVHSAVPWPGTILRFTYEGCDLQLVPPKRKAPGEPYDTYPLVVAEGGNGPEATARVQVGRRLLNALAWREQRAIREVGVEVTSWAMRQAVQVLGNATVDDFSTADLSVPSSSEARLALAFYREGLSVQHTGFQSPMPSGIARALPPTPTSETRSSRASTRVCRRSTSGCRRPPTR